MADEPHKQVSEETEKDDLRDLSLLEKSAILMDGRLRALAERTIAAKSPPPEPGETAP